MPNPDTWRANTSYASGTFVRPTVDNGCVYRATGAGLSGSTEPAWPTMKGQTVQDGGVTWVCMIERASYSVLSVAMNYIKNNGKLLTVCSANPTSYYQACNPPEWTAATSYSAGDVVRPTTRNGYVYVCTAEGTSGSSEPTWPVTVGATVTDGTVTWECYNNYALCATSLTSSDYTIAPTSDGGYSISVRTLNDILIFRSGVGNFIVISDTTNRDILLVIKPETPQNCVEGGLAVIQGIYYEIELPA